MNDSRASSTSSTSLLLLLLVGAPSGFLGGWSASWWFRETPEPSSRREATAPSNSETNEELERRIGELEEACSVALGRSRSSSGKRPQADAVAAALASSGKLAAPDGPAFEAAVRDVLTRLEDEEYQSREARRNQREEGRIRGFVGVLAERAGLDESTDHEVAAVLIAKREELRAEKNSLTSSDSTAHLTPRQRKEKRRQLEERVGAELDRALLEILGAERLETYRAVAKEERFELSD